MRQWGGMDANNVTVIHNEVVIAVSRRCFALVILLRNLCDTQPIVPLGMVSLYGGA